MSAAIDIVDALRNSIAWHAEQGRPHSEQVDRDALDEIERLRAALAERTLPEQVRKAMAGELGTHATKEGA